MVIAIDIKFHHWEFILMEEGTLNSEKKFTEYLEQNVQLQEKNGLFYTFC